MNREIKFRGKRGDNDEWVYGSLIYDVNEKWYIHQNNFVFWAGYCEIIPETIGQYTGLKDKNGKEIYEGDIVIHDNEWTKPNETGVITWNKNNSSFQIKGHIPSSSMKHLNRMKVIGNIYESEVTNE